MKPLITVIQFIGRYTAALLAVGVLIVLWLMLAGCTATDDVTGGANGSDGKQGSAIAFSVCSDSTTRAANTRTAPGTMTLDGTGSTVSLKEKGFGVFACHTGAHPYVSSSASSNLMWNQQITYNGGSSQWEYNPLVYWPSGDEGKLNYVTFYAYAPYKTASNGCIADLSAPDDMGDPWILYQLGGTSEDWQDSQVDLVYDFKKDMSRQYPVSTQIGFDFKHALASIGDEITITCSSELQAALKALYTGTDVTMTLNTLTIDYLLTRKGRLVLNNSKEPNWQAVESEDAKVHRYLRLSPNQVIARATSASNCTINNYTAQDKGIFYIPLEVGPDRQMATLTADYTVAAGSPAYVIDKGSVTATVNISFFANASEGRNLRITLNIPDVECGGAPLANATVGQTICEHGRVHASTTGSLSCGGRKVALVAYTGSGSGEGGFNHGLAMALKDAGTGAWCSTSGVQCLSARAGSSAEALAMLNGTTATSQLVAHASHTHSAAAAARSFIYNADMGVAGWHPVGTSQWMLPSMGQWNLMLMAMTGVNTGLTQSANAAYAATAVNGLFTAAGGSGLQNAGYWSSTESGSPGNNAWQVNMDEGKINARIKTDQLCVRPVIAF